MSLTIDTPFPLKVSRGARGGPVWNTRILSSTSGFEQRIRLGSEPIFKYDIELNAWSEADLKELLEFFNVVGGQAGSFRFRDWEDYFAGMTLGSSGPVYGTPVQIGVGNATATAFQLTKTYTKGSGTWVRRITRPVAGTVKVYLNGVEQASGWTLNAGTGVVTFSSAPGSGVVVAWAGQFDVPARFANDALAIGLQGIRHGRASQAIWSIKE